MTDRYFKMKNRITRIALTLALSLLFCLTQHATAQDAWDTALDRYESICIRVLQLRERIADGKPVDSNEIQQLTDELRALRSMLQNDAGSMSAAQQERFSMIRGMMATGVIRRTGLAPFLPKVRPSVTCALVDQSAGAHLPVPPLSTSHVPGPSSAKKVTLLTEMTLRDGMPGARFQVRVAPRFDAYLAAHSLFTRDRSEYTGSLNGTTEFGFLWPTGKSLLQRYDLTGGAVFTPCSSPFSFFAGAGYCQRSLQWQDESKSWVQIREKSFSGLQVEAGAQWHWKWLCISAGASLHPGGFPDGIFGLGVRF